MNTKLRSTLPILPRKSEEALSTKSEFLRKGKDLNWKQIIVNDIMLKMEYAKIIEICEEPRSYIMETEEIDGI